MLNAQDYITTSFPNGRLALTDSLPPAPAGGVLVEATT